MAWLLLLPAILLMSKLLLDRTQSSSIHLSLAQTVLDENNLLYRDLHERVVIPEMIGPRRFCISQTATHAGSLQYRSRSPVTISEVM